MIDILSVIEAILFAAGESVPVARLSLILGVGEDEVLAAARELQAVKRFQGGTMDEGR